MITVGTYGFGRRQADVFQDFQAVEIQNTIYRPVSVDLARRWRAAAPADFVFCVKASQFITHETSSPTYRRAGRHISAASAPACGGSRSPQRLRKAGRPRSPLRTSSVRGLSCSSVPRPRGRPQTWNNQGWHSATSKREETFL